MPPAITGEIIVIALGTVADKSIGTQFAVLAGIGALMTVGVYGLVTGIVKLDDLGAWLLQQGNRLAQRLGKLFLLAAPKLMKFLSVVGTAAMFLVGGGILTHGVPPLHHGIEGLSAMAGALAPLVAMTLDGLVGVFAGVLALGAVQLGQQVKNSRAREAS